MAGRSKEGKDAKMTVDNRKRKIVEDKQRPSNEKKEINKSSGEVQTEKTPVKSKKRWNQRSPTPELTKQDKLKDRERIINTQFNENEEVMEMEVDAEQDGFLSDEANEDHAETNDSDESDDEDMASQNNNAIQYMNSCDGEENSDCELGEDDKTGSHRTNGQESGISKDKRDEIVEEAYDKAMSKMKECMEEVMSTSGLMETAQFLQKQLQ